MNDIKDILIEMEKLSDNQLAVTLSEEEKEELTKLVTSPRGTNPTCGSCSDTIPYCCKVSIPKNFNTNFTEKKLSVTSSLFCFVDPCPCDVTVTPSPSCPTSITVTLYPIRVIGCIQFIASAASVQGDCGLLNPTESTLTPLSTANNTAAISCEGSLCVNQIVNFQNTEPTTDDLRPKKIDCEDISASLKVALEDCNCNPVTGDIKVVSFSGQFKFPQVCPDPTCAP